MKVWQQRVLRLLQWLAGMRYVKFGVVGARGTVVNMAVLYLCHNYVFDVLEAQKIVNGKATVTLMPASGGGLLADLLAAQQTRGGGPPPPSR